MKGEALVFILFAVVIWIQNLQVCRSHHATCDRTYSKVDCVDTYQNRIRIYNQLIITDRDSKSSKASGIPTDWFHWEEYLLGLVCRCMEKLNRMSEGNLSIYNQFTIENYGECWSSRHGHDTLHTLTRSNNCIGAGYLDCQSRTMSECTGTQLSSFLYQIENRTKLLDEHCHIVKRIVCPSSTILQNSSSPSQFLRNLTMFVNSTSTRPYTTSRVQRNSTAFVNSTNSSEYGTSQVLRSSTAVINTTSSRHYTISSEVLQNSSVLVVSNSTKTWQYVNSQVQNSTVPINGTKTWQYTYSQIHSPSLKSSSMNASFQEWTSKKFSNQTDSMLSQAQTLNTGMLYTSGSKLPNITLAPTQFFITTSIRYTPTATTKFSNVESTKAIRSNHSRSQTLPKLSETTVSTPSNTERIGNKSYYTSNDTSFIRVGLSGSSETAIHTSRLNFALSGINTSPIEATSVQTSQSNFHQNPSTSESDNQIPSTNRSATLLTSRSSWQPNITTSPSLRQQTGAVVSTIPKSYQSNASRYVTTTRIIYAHLPVEPVQESPDVPHVSQSSSIISIDTHYNTTSSLFKDLPPSLSTDLSNRTQNIIQPSYIKSSLQRHSNASIKNLISKSSFSDIYSSNAETMTRKHSSIKRRETSEVSSRSAHVNIAETSSANEPSLTSTSEFKESSSHLNNTSPYPTVLLKKTPTFGFRPFSPLEETTSTIRRSKSNTIKVSYGISRESHATIRLHSSNSQNVTSQSPTMLSLISTNSMTTSKTSSDNSQSLTILSSRNDHAGQSSLKTPSAQSNINCKNTAHGCGRNSAGTQLSKIFVIFVTQFMFIHFV